MSSAQTSTEALGCCSTKSAKTGAKTILASNGAAGLPASIPLPQWAHLIRQAARKFPPPQHVAKVSNSFHAQVLEHGVANAIWTTGLLRHLPELLHDIMGIQIFPRASLDYAFPPKALSLPTFFGFGQRLPSSMPLLDRRISKGPDMHHIRGLEAAIDATLALQCGLGYPLLIFNGLLLQGQLVGCICIAISTFDQQSHRHGATSYKRLQGVLKSFNAMSILRTHLKISSFGSQMNHGP